MMCHLSYFMLFDLCGVDSDSCRCQYHKIQQHIYH
jgi:hypothetical protein